MAKVLFVNNDGGGYADYLDVADGTTVESFFQEQLPDRKASDYLIRVNRQPVARDYVLQDGDRITMTPTKIEGAGSAWKVCSVAANARSAGSVGNCSSGATS